MSLFNEFSKQALRTNSLSICFFSILIASAVWSKNLHVDFGGSSIGVFSILACITIVLGAINLNSIIRSVSLKNPALLFYYFLTALILLLTYSIDEHPREFQKIIKYLAYATIAAQLTVIDKRLISRIWQCASLFCFVFLLYFIFADLEFITIHGYRNGESFFGAKRFHLGTSGPNASAISALASIVLCFLALSDNRVNRLQAFFGILATSTLFIFILYTQSRSIFLLALVIFAIALAFTNLKIVVSSALLSVAAYFWLLNPEHISEGFFPRLIGSVADGFGGRVVAVCNNITIDLSACSIDHAILQQTTDGDISSHNLFVSLLASEPSLAVENSVDYQESYLLSFVKPILALLYFCGWFFVCLKNKYTAGLLVVLATLGASLTANIYGLHSVMILLIILPAIVVNYSNGSRVS